jgi:hypothetical protein
MTANTDVAHCCRLSRCSVCCFDLNAAAPRPCRLPAHPSRRAVSRREVSFDSRRSQVAQSLDLASRRCSGRRCHLLSRDPCHTLGRFRITIRHAHETFHTSGWAVTDGQGPSARPPAPAALERCRVEGCDNRKRRQSWAETSMGLAGRSWFHGWI